MPTAQSARPAKTEQVCRRCTRHETTHSTGICVYCRQTLRRKRWEGMTPQERVNRRATALAQDNSDKPLPPPTEYLPGSAEKIELMIERVAAGFRPTSPDDARDQ